MDDAALVGVLNGVTNLKQYFKLKWDGSQVVAGVCVQRLAFDELHGKPRLSAVAEVEGACGVDVGDAGMLEAGEDFGFVLETAECGGRCESGSQEFDGDAAMGPFLLGFVDDAHSAGADAAEYFEFAELSADEHVTGG